METNKPSINPEMEVRNEEEPEILEPARLFQKKREVSGIAFINELCEYILELCKGSNECGCMNIVSLFDSNLSVLKTFQL